MTSPSASITLTQAASRLGVHYMTAYRYVRTGALEAEQRGGKWWVAESALDAFEEHRARTVSRPGRPRSTDTTAVDRPSSLHRASEFANRLISGDQEGSWRILQDAVNSGADLSQVNSSLITPALRLIGDRWQAGELSIAAEHRATVVAMRLIDRLGRQFLRPGRKRGTVVICAAPGDRHALPSAIIADMLRAAGLEAVDLGADSPGEEILRTAMDQDLLIAAGICVTLPLDPDAELRLRDTVRAIGGATGRPVLVGGSGITSEATAIRLSADHWSRDADDAVNWFVELSKYRPTSAEQASL